LQAGYPQHVHEQNETQNQCWDMGTIGNDWDNCDGNDLATKKTDKEWGTDDKWTTGEKSSETKIRCDKGKTPTNWNEQIELIFQNLNRDISLRAVCWCGG